MEDAWKNCLPTYMERKIWQCLSVRWSGRSKYGNWYKEWREYRRDMPLVGPDYLSALSWQPLAYRTIIFILKSFCTIFPKFRTNHVTVARHNLHFHPIQRSLWNETSFNVPELFSCESWIKQIRNYSGLTLIPPPVSFPFKWPLFGIRGAAYPSHRCHQHVLPPLVNRQQCNCHLVSRFKVALAFRFLFSLSSSSSFHNPHNPAQRGPCWLCLCCA